MTPLLVIAVVFFAGADGNRQVILGGGDGTGGINGEGTGWADGAIEVDNYFAVLGFTSHQKPPGAVGFFATGGIPEVEKEPFAGCDGVEGIALASDIEAYIAGAGGVIDIAKHGLDGDSFAVLIRHKVGFDAVGWVVVEPDPPGEGCPYCAVAVAQADADTVTTGDDKEAEVAVGNHVRLVLAVAITL